MVSNSVMEIRKKKKKKKKKHRVEFSADALPTSSTSVEDQDGVKFNNGGKKKRKRKMHDVNVSDSNLEFSADEDGVKLNSGDKEFVNEAGGRKVVDVNAVNVGVGNNDKKKKKKKKKRKKKANSLEEGSEGINIGTENPTSRKKSKKVSFSDHVEVFTSSDDGPKNGKNFKEDDGLVRGKRFSQEEDEKIKEAVANYIEVHGTWVR